MYIICLIPARSGSKGIPNKNIKLLNDKPLIAYSIEQSINNSLINRTIVTTDSEEIAKIARKYGAETPFIRPKEISKDESTDYDFFEHYLNYEKKMDNDIPDLIIQLRPTTPIRNNKLIEDAIKIMLDNYDNYDSLRSVIPTSITPFKTYIQKDNKLLPLFNDVDGKKEPYNLGRQSLPKTYLHNGYIDIVKSECILNKKSVSGDNIYPFNMSELDIYDIDTYNDWNKVKNKMSLL